jgi:hypothetical protein
MTSNRNSVSPAKAELRAGTPACTSPFTRVTPLPYPAPAGIPRDELRTAPVHTTGSASSSPLRTQNFLPTAAQHLTLDFGHGTAPNYRALSRLTSPPSPRRNVDSTLLRTAAQLWTLDFGHSTALNCRGLSRLISPPAPRRNVDSILLPTAAAQLWTLDVGLWTMAAIRSPFLSREIIKKPPYSLQSPLKTPLRLTVPLLFAVIALFAFRPSLSPEG